jgi:hypothetical protein
MAIYARDLPLVLQALNNGCRSSLMKAFITLTRVRTPTILHTP